MATIIDKFGTALRDAADYISGVSISDASDRRDVATALEMLYRALWASRPVLARLAETGGADASRAVADIAAALATVAADIADAVAANRLRYDDDDDDRPSPVGDALKLLLRADTTAQRVLK